MNIAILLRYMNQNHGGHWDHIYHMQHDYELIARKYGVGLVAIITEFDAEKICDICDGLILPGSPNMIHPRYYGKEPTADDLRFFTPHTVDEYGYDSKIIGMFVKLGKPIFGVCGGVPELNVYFGGTRETVNINGSHGLLGVSDRKMHDITVKRGFFVYDVFGKERVSVNSHRRGGIGKLAEDFDAVAVCDDGVIEAIENKEKKIFATQWHPEQSFHTGDPMEQKFLRISLKFVKLNNTKKEKRFASPF